MDDKKSRIVTTPFGKDGGNEFSFQVPRSIGLRSDTKLDQIKINNSVHGGNGGYESITLELAEDEYISFISLLAGRVIHNVHFKTNKGNELTGQGYSAYPHTLEKIRLLAIGGRSERLVDQLRFKYIENYNESTVEEEIAHFILDYTPPNTTMKHYVEDRHKTLDAFEKITKNMIHKKFGASVTGEYYVLASVSTEIDFQNSTTTGLKKEISDEKAVIDSTTRSVNDGQVGINVVQGRLMKESEGDEKKYWIYPTSVPSYSVIKQSEIKNILNHYDLTGELHSQMAGLSKFKTERNGYVYYSAKK